MSKLAIDYIFSQGFQIYFRLFEAKFLPRIYVKGKFSKEKVKVMSETILALASFHLSRVLNNIE